MSNYAPCGRTIGHGETCQHFYLCGHCERIKELEKENADLKVSIERIVENVIEQYAGAVEKALPKQEK